jgi:squalene-hopene/tetraprenyl-beta-curcumene cyclase
VGAADLALAAVEPLLAGQQATGGWGYHRDVPDDCDSTAYALAFLAGAGSAAADAVAAGTARLLSQQRADGGFATYGDGRAIRAFMRLPAQVPLDGWTSTHPEVTAAAGLALAAVGARDPAERAWACLAALQHAEGGWQSYWWTNDLYATALAVRLARTLGIASKEIGRAVEWCERGQTHCGAWRDGHSGAHSVFATALGLLVLGPDGDTETVAQGRDWLLATQRPDGGWDGEYALRIPPQQCRNPAVHTAWQEDGLAAGAVIRDQGGCYVTATVLRALAE